MGGLVGVWCGGRKRKKFHRVFVYAECRVGTGFCHLCLGSNPCSAIPAPARHQSTSGHLSMSPWKPLCTAFMHVH